jgi:acyl carrier protein
MIGMDKNEVKEKLRAFVVKELIRNPKYTLKDDEPLITGGLIDSFSLAHFGVFVEDEFGIYIPDPDLTVENLNTLNQMVDRIMRDA